MEPNQKIKARALLIASLNLLQNAISQADRDQFGEVQTSVSQTQELLSSILQLAGFDPLQAAIAEEYED